MLVAKWTVSVYQDEEKMLPSVVKVWRKDLCTEDKNRAMAAIQDVVVQTVREDFPTSKKAGPPPTDERILASLHHWSKKWRSAIEGEVTLVDYHPKVMSEGEVVGLMLMRVNALRLVRKWSPLVQEPKSMTRKKKFKILGKWFHGKRLWTYDVFDSLGGGFEELRSPPDWKYEIKYFWDENGNPREGW